MCEVGILRATKIYDMTPDQKEKLFSWGLEEAKFLGKFPQSNNSNKNNVFSSVQVFYLGFLLRFEVAVQLVDVDVDHPGRPQSSSG